MAAFYLVRHAITDWNEQQRFQGNSNISLNERGLAQAENLRLRFAAEELSACFASDLLRARETAEGIIRDHELMLEAEPRLREINFGAWEGMTYAEIKDEYPDKVAAWEENWSETAPPEGERFGDFVSRIEDFYREFMQGLGQENVLLVAHGGSLQILLCMFLEIDPGKFWQFKMEPASVTSVQVYEAGAILNVLNDTSHLAQLTGE